MGRVLVVDDDAAMRESLEDLLSAAGWQVTVFSRAKAALGRLADVAPDVVLSDVRMPGVDGLDLLTAITGPDMPPVILISAHGDIPMAVDAVRKGAYSFVEKPYEPHRLLSILRHAADQFRMAQESKRLRDRLSDLAGLNRVLLGENPDVQALRHRVMDYARSNAPVAVVGETGTGKEIVARALHDLSERSAGPFIAVNVATLRADHFEEEMFGRAGETLGRLREADGGTLFLDEMGSCDISVQSKLMRVLETGVFHTPGINGTHRVDVRTVSAFRHNSRDVVEAGLLSADLAFRLTTLSLWLPPLRQRTDDVLLLFGHFTEHFAKLYETSIPAPSTSDLAALVGHAWPGNVRELRNVAERFVLASCRGTASVQDAIDIRTTPSSMPTTLREAISTFEREMIGRAIARLGGRMDDVADTLGIGRRTLNEKIVKLGIEKDEWLSQTKR